MTVIDEIADERRRQLEAEGWSETHDDSHLGGELCAAAAVYAAWSIPTIGQQIFDLAWPWARKWWKPKDRRRDLIRAGALIVAEIERLDRKMKTREAAR